MDGAVAPGWELGSEFAWDAAAWGTRGDRPFPPDARLFATGTGALTAFLVTRPPGARLHLPTFFCMEVAAAWAEHIAVRWYPELPDGVGPDLGALRPERGDVVVAVNLFGRSSRERWAGLRRREDVVLVEDHTHDPLSGWAADSDADLCVASLRKTLPVPDGAVLWSPRGAAVPGPEGGVPDGAYLKLEAMVLKAAHHAGAGVEREEFRRLHTEGERRLAGRRGRATTATAEALRCFDLPALRERRARNAQALLTALAVGRGLGDLRAHGRPADGSSVSFGVQIECPSTSRRDALRRHLRDRRVWAPVHWAQPAATTSGDPAAISLASRVLTLPTDHRYDVEDMERVARAVHGFTA